MHIEVPVGGGGGRGGEGYKTAVIYVMLVFIAFDSSLLSCYGFPVLTVVYGFSANSRVRFIRTAKDECALRHALCSLRCKDLEVTGFGSER